MKGELYLALLFVFLLFSQIGNVQAASFDCHKARTKIEKMICSDDDVSKLDELMSSKYRLILREDDKKSAFIDFQQKWLKKRDRCNDTKCLKKMYGERIADLQRKIVKMRPEATSYEHYYLVMDKSSGVCDVMLQHMNEDMQKHIRTYGEHATFIKEYSEFNSIGWKKIKVKSNTSGNERVREVLGAKIDLNNDGVIDFVVKDEGVLSGIRVDALYVIKESDVKDGSPLIAGELYKSKNRIELDQISYELDEPLKGKSVDLWLLSPLVFKGETYVYMQSMYKVDYAIDGDFVVIGKYLGGDVGQNHQNEMRDVCYIKRVRNNGL